MSERSLKVGLRVDIQGKDVKGTVAYVGNTLFSSGKWIGVVLDEPKGKNNGTLQGKTYFTCKENHGIFVRQSQLLNVDPDDEEGSVVSTPGSTPSSTPSATTPSTEDRRPQRIFKPPPSAAQPTPIKEEDRRQSFAPPTPKEGTPVSTRSGNISGANSKRASFIEVRSDSLTSLDGKSAPSPSRLPVPLWKTNFVETITPTFNAMTSSIIEDKITTLQKDQEMENLRTEVKDLQEKLETIKIKRTQDKEKLKEAEKTKIQIKQLLEFKVKIMESQADLQKELQKAKQEAREAIEDKETHAEEMSELSEAVEMATLDREMAEEKCESLQQEVDHLKEKLEELNLDMEIIKNEMSEKGPEGTASTYQVKQLEQQNERLREALVKMRDLSAHEKNEQQRMQKDLDYLNTQITEMNKSKERLTAQVDEYEKQMVDLKEQVDAALGAEEMVEQLTERNLNLEEKLAESLDNIQVLESLADMNEELQENSRETELELREETDMIAGKMREVQRKLEASQETIADLEQTIQKYRELTDSFRDRNQDLVEQLEKATNKAVAAPLEMFDFKIKFAETKAHARAVDMELRRMEVQQANQHVTYLCMFMLENFLTRGGDHDSILVLLLLPRMAWKAEILINQAKEKFPPPECIDTESVLKSHKVEQSSFGCRLSHLLYSLQTLLHQYIFGLSTCNVDLFLKMGMLYPELSIQEKSIDFYIDLLRKDQLDENISLEPLDKTVSYFQNLYRVHFSNEKFDCTVLINDSVKTLGAACDCLATEIARLRVLLQPKQESSDMGLLLKDLEASTDDLKQYIKKIRRRIPQDGSTSPLSFSKEVQTNLSDCSFQLGRVVRALADLGQAAMQQVGLLPDPSSGLSNQKLKELAHQATDKVYGKEDSGPLDSLRQTMSGVTTIMQKLATAMQDGVYDFDGTAEPKTTAPIMLRAQAVKDEIKDADGLKYKISMRDADILDLKKALKLKSEEMSEIQVRKDLSEKRVETLSKEGDQKIEQLQLKYDELVLLRQKETKDFERTLDHLQADLEALEQENTELKDKVRTHSKKVLIEGLSKSTGLSSLTSPTSPTVAFGSPVVRESSASLQQVESLKLAIRNIRNENMRLQAEKMKTQLSELEPLNLPKKPTGFTSLTGQVATEETGSDEINVLAKKASSMLQEIHKMTVNGTVVDISKRRAGAPPVTESGSPASHLVDNITKLMKLADETKHLQVEVTNVLSSNKVGGQVHSTFSQFPTTQYVKVLEEQLSESQLIGRVTIPAPPGSGSHVVPICLDHDSFRQLHARLLS